MSQVLETSQTSTREIYYPLSTDDEEIIYPEQREDDMGEASIHIKLITNFLQTLLLYFREREDVFLSGNMNLYYEEKNPNKWYAPDLLIAFGVPNHERSSYQVWKEKVFPQVIFEIASDRTWKTDVSEKLELYGTFGAEEYYILDPEFNFLPAPMLAFHRQNGRLLSAPINDGRIFSPRLELEIVRTKNNFRLFNPNTNEFLRTMQEYEEQRQATELRARNAEAELERLKEEIERLKAGK